MGPSWVLLLLAEVGTAQYRFPQYLEIESAGNKGGDEEDGDGFLPVGF